MTSSPATTATATADLNEWATARSGNARIRLYSDRGGVRVYALDGHELLPRTRDFVGPNAEADARTYANTLWATV
jgi:hypothetical protein